MDPFEAERARARAAFNTGTQNLFNRTDRMTHRMAGGALAAALLPGLMSSVDNQEENIAQQLLSAGITVGGASLGTVIDRDHNYMSPEQIDEYIKDEIVELKRKSKENMKTKGVEEANAEFARAKQKLYEDFQPVDSQKGRREVFRKVTGADLLSQTPRNLRSLSRGALLGAIAAAPLAYGVLRGGEIE